MKRTVNWKDLNLQRQCGVCEHFKPKIIGSMLTARGSCSLNGVYKMRTETCSKYKSKGE